MVSAIKETYLMYGCDLKYICWRAAEESKRNVLFFNHIKFDLYTYTCVDKSVLVYVLLEI